MTDTICFLHIEDNPLDAEIVEAELCGEWTDCTYVLISTEKDLIAALTGEMFTIVLSDYSLPGFDGMTALSIVQELSPDTPFLFVSGTMGEDLAIESLKSGATDYILKAHLAKLIPSIYRAMSEQESKRERNIYLEEMKKNYERLELMQEVNQYHATTVQELLDFALDKVIALTASRFGNIYHYNEETCLFTLNSWSKDVMDSCRVAEQSICQLEKTGMCGEVVRQRRPIIVNDFAAPHPHKKGYPEGHIHLSRFMSIPVTANNRIVAVVGVANKTAPYDQNDVLQLTLLMDGIWKITERLALEDKISSVSREWQTTFDSISDSIALIDSEQRIMRCNLATTQTLGCDFDGILNQTCWRVIHGTESPIPDCPMEKAKRSLHLETAIIQKNNQWFEVSVHPILSDSGELLSAVHIMRDITNNMQAEENLHEIQMQLLQNDKMATIGQLAAGVAHEINNPMGFVSSNMVTLTKYIEKYNRYIEMLEDELRSGSSGQLPEQIQKLHQSLKLDYVMHDISVLLDENNDGLDRIKRIVQDLRTFSRSDTSVIGTTDLNSCMDSTINIVINEIKYIAELKRDYSDLPKVPCNAQQINQVFMNLLINASHAIQTKGEEFGEIVVHTWCDADNAFVSISDNGCGIAPEHQGKIFDAFYTTKDVGKGTGLGLSISAGIIRKHCGDITVDSKADKGSIFTIRLPLKHEQHIDKESQ